MLYYVDTTITNVLEALLLTHKQSTASKLPSRCTTYTIDGILLQGVRHFHVQSYLFMPVLAKIVIVIEQVYVILRTLNVSNNIFISDKMEKLLT